jgi:hypothetical protein
MVKRLQVKKKSSEKSKFSSKNSSKKFVKKIRQKHLSQNLVKNQNSCHKNSSQKIVTKWYGIHNNTKVTQKIVHEENDIHY